MAIDLTPTAPLKVYKYTFEAFGCRTYILSMMENWDKAQDAIKSATGAATAHIISCEMVEASADEYADHCLQKLIEKNRRK